MLTRFLLSSLAAVALSNSASAQSGVLDYNEALRALSGPVVQSYSDFEPASLDTVAAVAPASDCPYVITYSDGSTDCLRKPVPDDNILFAKPREVNALVEFASASAVLTPLGKRNLDTIIAVVQTPSANLDEANFSVAGHTNAAGNSAYNQWLSEQRAKAVVDYLTQSGKIKTDRIDSVGYGEEQLLSGLHPNSAQNRRVMIEVVR